MVNRNSTADSTQGTSDERISGPDTSATQVISILRGSHGTLLLRKDIPDGFLPSMAGFEHTDTYLRYAPPTGIAHQKTNVFERIQNPEASKPNQFTSEIRCDVRLARRSREKSRRRSCQSTRSKGVQTEHPTPSCQGTRSKGVQTEHPALSSESFALNLFPTALYAEESYSSVEEMETVAPRSVQPALAKVITHSRPQPVIKTSCIEEASRPPRAVSTTKAQSRIAWMPSTTLPHRRVASQPVRIKIASELPTQPQIRPSAPVITNGLTIVGRGAPTPPTATGGVELHRSTRRRHVRLTTR